MPATIPNLVSFTSKLRVQAQMMHQISDFSLDSAQCTIASDRQIVEKHVTQLFEGNPVLGSLPGMPQDSLTRFNNFMRHEMRSHMEARIGDVTRLPFSISLLVFLPLNFQAVANVLGCDSAPCEESAQAEGFTTVPQYMLTNTAFWLNGCLLVYPTTWPVMLMGLAAINKRFEGRTATALGLMCAIMSCAYMGFYQGFACAVVLNAVILPGKVWMALLAVLLGAEVMWHHYLFRLPVAGYACFFVGFLGYVAALGYA